MSIFTNQVSSWKLDESSGNATDSVGSNTLANTNVTYATGLVNNGAVFNGTNAKLVSGSNLGISGAGARTFSMWVKFSAQPSASTFTLFNYGVAVADNYQSFEYTDTAGAKTLNWGAAGDDLTVSQTFSNGVWYHILGTFDGTTATLYVNGVSVGSANKAGWNTTNSHATFGAFLTGSAQFLNGMMDMIDVWSRVLTSDEIAFIYNNGLGNQYPYHYSITTTDTVALSETFTSLQSFYLNPIETVTMTEAVSAKQGWSNPQLKHNGTWTNQSKT